MKVRYSETFYSPQGEGKYVGVGSVWLRFAKCNLQCHGFGQTDPTDPDTYVLDFKEYDPKANGIERIEDLPVWTRGCDSSYTWAKKYKHLLSCATPQEICDILEEHMKNEFNPDGKFFHPRSQQHTHMCFTGGEPLYSQNELIAVMDEFIARDNLPHYVTIETNTTRKLSAAFIEGIKRWRDAGMQELFFSCSPKLFSVSGEKPKKAIRPDVIKQYNNMRNLVERYSSMRITGQIKIVANGTPATWQEFEDALSLFRAEGVNWPVYAMPCGATLEEQEVKAADVAMQAINRGYIVAPRVHVYLFGNAIGT